ncbi:MAG: hypothetical protein QGF53_11475 [Alphaproteobacteria bacterium]|jgi:hypothetical protein|nr:hypothetical protein [Alphaproteobacteria bacterium]MDP6953364.1 hypothetical protein [Alphaproteobacteria bacterium]
MTLHALMDERRWDLCEHALFIGFYQRLLADHVGGHESGDTAFHHDPADRNGELLRLYAEASRARMAPRRN